MPAPHVGLEVSTPGCRTLTSGRMVSPGNAFSEPYICLKSAPRRQLFRDMVRQYICKADVKCPEEADREIRSYTTCTRGCGRGADLPTSSSPFPTESFPSAIGAPEFRRRGCDV